MKKLFAGLVLALLCLSGARQASAQANVGGLLYAAQFGGWTVPQGTNGPYAWSSPSFCQINANAVTFAAFTVGTPIQIIDSNPAMNEIVVPTAVLSNGFGCSITITPVYQHNSFHFASATGGLQEAINYAIGKNSPAVVILTTDWSALGGTTTIIGQVTGNTSITISDQRTSYPNPYAWNGSQYVLQPIGAVGKIIAGNNISISPTSGIGNVTINSTAAGGVTSFNSRTGAVVPQAGDYLASQVTNAADVTAQNTFLQYQTFNLGVDLLGTGSYVNENFFTFNGSTTESHNAGTFDIFKPLGTATSSQNYASMFGPQMQASYWQGTAAATGGASPFVTCAAGTNPLCIWSLHWLPDNAITPVGTATFAENLPGPLTVPDLFDTALTTVNDCLMVGAAGHVTQGPCSGGGVNATSLQGVGISATAPTTGQALIYNGSQWAPGSGSAGVQLSSATSQIVSQATNTTLAVNNLNNFFLASQYGNGTTNSIATAVALNSGTGQDTVVDPGYASTETIPGLQTGPYGGALYNAIPNYPQFTHLEDDRVGKQYDIFTETGSAAYTTHAAKSNFYFNTYDVTGPTLLFNGFMRQNVFEGQGQQINGFGGVNLKTYWFGNAYNTLSNAAGQTLANINEVGCYGVGDCIVNTLFAESSGGSSTYTDEGLHGYDGLVQETQSVPIGTITSQGSGFIKASMTSGQGKEGRLLYLGDDTEKIATGLTTIGDNAFPAPLTITTGQNWQVPPMANVPGASFTPSTIIMGCTTAYGGTCPQSGSSNPTGQLQSASGGYAPGTVNVLVVTAAPGLPTAYSTTSSGFSPGDTVCVADSQYMEQATVTAVPDSAHITINFAWPHFNGFTIAKGGYCGYGIESTGSTTTVPSSGATVKQVFPVVATLDATDLLVWDHDSQQTWSRALIGNNSQSACQTDNINNFSFSGGNITVYDTGLNALFRNASGVTVSVPGFASWTPSGTVTMTTATANIGGIPSSPVLTYPITGTPTGSPTTGTITFCNSFVNLYPIAETTAVLNPSTNASDGYFGLAPYSVSFATGDTVEQFHWPWQQVSYSGLTARQELPLPGYSAFTMGYDEEVGDNFSSYAAHNVKNNTAIGKYQGYGGVLTLGAGTIAYNVQGLFGVLLNNYNYAPDYAIINNPNCKAAPIGCSNAALSPIAIYSGVGSQEKIWDNVPFGSIDFGGSIRLNHGSFSGAIYMPSAGNFALSADQSASPTADGNLTLNNLTVNGTCTGCGGTATLPTGTTNQMLYYATGGTTVTPLTLGSNLSITAGVLNASGSGTVYPGAGIAVSTGSAWTTSKTAPAGTIVGTTDTQTLTNKTLDGVTPATMAFVDATSSIQTQINGKQASLGYTPAHSGSNSDITSLSGLASPLSVGQGGTGTATPGVSCTGAASCTGTWPNITINASTGNISGLTAGYIPLAGSGTSITSNSPMDYNITNPSEITSTKPIVITGSGTASAFPQVSIGGGSTVSAVNFLSTASISPTAVSANACSDQTFTVSGLATTSNLGNIKPPGSLGNISLSGYASATNLLLLHFCNVSGSSVTPPTGVYSFLEMH